MKKEIVKTKVPARDVQSTDTRPCYAWISADHQGECEMLGTPAWDAVQELMAQCATDDERDEILAGTLHVLDWEMVVSYMDDELREAIHGQLAPCTVMEFFAAYQKAHEQKFGESFLW